MPTKPKVLRPTGARSKGERDREHDARRGSAASRGYGSRWREARIAYLAAHPLCTMCADEDVIRPATVVDHIVPHRGDYKLFWRRSNWQPLCKPHHDREKQRLDREVP